MLRACNVVEHLCRLRGLLNLITKLTPSTHLCLPAHARHYASTHPLRSSLYQRFLPRLQRHHLPSINWFYEPTPLCACMRARIHHLTSINWFYKPIHACMHIELPVQKLAAKVSLQGLVGAGLHTQQHVVQGNTNQLLHMPNTASVCHHTSIELQSQPLTQTP